MNETIDQAVARIQLLRNTKLDEALKESGGPWMDRLVAEPRLVHPHMEGYVAVTYKMQVLVHAGIEGAFYLLLCQWGCGHHAASSEEKVVKLQSLEAAEKCGGVFCIDCFRRLPASKAIEVREVYGADTTRDIKDGPYAT